MAIFAKIDFSGLKYPHEMLVELNIAKGTTDPRVEFISHDITQIFQFQNLD